MTLIVNCLVLKICLLKNTINLCNSSYFLYLLIVTKAKIYIYEIIMNLFFDFVYVVYFYFLNSRTVELLSFYTVNAILTAYDFFSVFDATEWDVIKTFK